MVLPLLEFAVIVCDWLNPKLASLVGANPPAVACAATDLHGVSATDQKVEITHRRLNRNVEMYIVSSFWLVCSVEECAKEESSFCL